MFWYQHYSNKFKWYPPLTLPVYWRKQKQEVSSPAIEDSFLLIICFIKLLNRWKMERQLCLFPFCVLDSTALTPIVLGLKLFFATLYNKLWMQGTLPVFPIWQSLCSITTFCGMCTFCVGQSTWQLASRQWVLCCEHLARNKTFLVLLSWSAQHYCKK